MPHRPGDILMVIPIDQLHCQRIGCTRPATALTITLSEAWERSHHGPNTGRTWVTFNNDEAIVDATPTCRAHTPE